MPIHNAHLQSSQYNDGVELKYTYDFDDNGILASYYEQCLIYQKNGTITEYEPLRLTLEYYPR